MQVCVIDLPNSGVNLIEDRFSPEFWLLFTPIS